MTLCSFRASNIYAGPIFLSESVVRKWSWSENMANLPLRLPNQFRSFSITASSTNGAPFNMPKSGGPVILEIPLEKIRRPLMRTRANDPVKVKDLMASISEIGLQEPIDVLEVDGVYYGFSGCHRYEAHQRLGLSTIRCKIRKGTKETLRHHLR
ncbi:hypothetical protein NE237_002430 [Protea cynaroides]|uniref:sulfiredoxin n=1 Tax=Protea cynaroides TaxID=273540 RepID=A0A9Q0QZD4_9MAGN|nr:hypothetical protein NE237_002430 [Protea cynaroides]